VTGLWQHLSFVLNCRMRTTLLLSSALQRRIWQSHRISSVKKLRFCRYFRVHRNCCFVVAMTCHVTCKHNTMFIDCWNLIALIDSVTCHVTCKRNIMFIDCWSLIALIDSVTCHVTCKRNIMFIDCWSLIALIDSVQQMTPWSSLLSVMFMWQ